MAIKHLESIRSLGKSLAVFALIIYTIVMIGMSVNKNYQTNQTIDRLQNEISDLRSEITELQNITYYYATDSYKEVEARRRLGVKAPDETIIILPHVKEENLSGEKENNDVSSDASNQETETNFQKWWKYLFDTSQKE